MKYFLDCEFNGMNGELLTLALVDERLRNMLYLAYPIPEVVDPWVLENVLPIINSSPIPPLRVTSALEGARFIEQFFRHCADSAPHIISDWPDDIAYISRAVITGPGTMIDLNAMTFEVVRVDAYPSSVAGAVQHNAMWDALALRRKVIDDVRSVFLTKS